MVLETLTVDYWVECGESQNKKWGPVKSSTISSPVKEAWFVAFADVCGVNIPITVNFKVLTWSWNSNTLATWCEEPTHWKRPWCWERLKAGEGDDRGWDGWMTSPTQWTWIWASSGSWWWIGTPGVLQSIRSQRVGHDQVTERNMMPHKSELKRGAQQRFSQACARHLQHTNGLGASSDLLSSTLPRTAGGWAVNSSVDGGRGSWTQSSLTCLIISDHLHSPGWSPKAWSKFNSSVL